MAQSITPAPAGKSHRALVIGGSGGIGRETAFELASRGIEVVVHGGHSGERLTKTVESMRADGGRASGFLHEIEEPGSFVDSLESLGFFDILVVAFGPFIRKSLSDTRSSDWERLALLDLALPGALVSWFLPRMKSAGWGRILLFGGTATIEARACVSNPAYACAKHGLGMLVRSAAAEGAPEVGSLLVCPGFVDTEYVSEPDRERLASRMPGGRLLAPRQLAEQALGLLLAEPCIATGSALLMDSGLRLS